MSDRIHSIHILGSNEFGGADQFYVRLARSLVEAGHPVTAVMRAGSPVADELTDDGSMERIQLPLANKWDLWSALRIKRIVLKNQPCIVQTYMGRATRLTRVPAGANAVHIARLGGFYKINGYYRHAKAWVGNTRAICDFLVKEGMPANRVFHIGNFVPAPLRFTEAAKQKIREEHAVSADAWVIFSLGRLIPKKGFQELLKAFSRLPAEIGGRPVVLMIAGDGPDAELLKKTATELGIAGRVRWLGWQNPPDAFYAIADLFVCPSRHEPLGNVILEGWNHELPVVSTRSHGALELIEEGVTGLLCDCRDDGEMAAKIQSALEASAADRQALATAGKAKLEANYSRGSITASYLSLYRDLLEIYRR